MAISTRELKRNVETQIKEMQREQEDFIARNFKSYRPKK